MTTQQGWVAECQDCEPTLGDYGETVPVHQEFAVDANGAANLWAFAHACVWDHAVIVRRFIRWDVDLAYMDEEIMGILFGRPI